MVADVHQGRVTIVKWTPRLENCTVGSEDRLSGMISCHSMRTKSYIRSILLYNYCRHTPRTIPDLYVINTLGQLLQGARVPKNCCHIDDRETSSTDLSNICHPVPILVGYAYLEKPWSCSSQLARFLFSHHETSSTKFYPKRNT
jgi:hypothetical protein